MPVLEGSDSLFWCVAKVSLLYAELIIQDIVPYICI